MKADPYGYRYSGEKGGEFCKTEKKKREREREREIYIYIYI